jgi:UDPglucose 6-dehydrogenase
MKISVIGTGYVGLVTGACFAEMGHTVTCMDSNLTRIRELGEGKIPFFEPGLPELVQTNQRAGRLRFSDSLVESLEGSAVNFIAVGTPPGEDGSADLSHVMQVAREIGRQLQHNAVIVTKSTVPVGTGDKVKAIIEEECARRSAELAIDVVSNPEFLKEGDAINDFMRPERIIVGSGSDDATAVMRALYAPFTRNHERLLVMSVRDAELTKYAANAMLATRISFMNEVANLCEHVGVDIENVRRGIGSDSRIGHAFIYAGCGYGGSCFPKDVTALVRMAEDSGLRPDLLNAVHTRNQSQKQRLFEKIDARFSGKLAGRAIGIWGLAYKPRTDDLREAPALTLIERLVEAGARVLAYDPVAMDATRRYAPPSWFNSGSVALVSDQYDAARDADALALVTEWKPFRNPDFGLIKNLMRTPVIFDGRNQYLPDEVRAAGIEYFGIGR